jgi:hypothetical protein
VLSTFFQKSHYANNINVKLIATPGAFTIAAAATSCLSPMPLHPMVILFLRHGKTGGTPVMPVTENAPRQLVLKSGSTTLTLDKDAGKAILQRKFLMWNLKPAETPLSEVARVTIGAAVDRASGVEVFHTMLVMRTGKGWGFPAANAQDAQRKADAIRVFLGLTT